MLKEKKQQTVVVWSVYAECLTEKMISALKHGNARAIRLVVLSGQEKLLANSLNLLKDAFQGHQISVPILVDVNQPARGVIRGFLGPKKIEFGDVLTFSRSQDKKDGFFHVESKEWESFFRQNELVYLGTGAVVLRTKEVSRELAYFEAIQGGTIFPEMEVHVPSTRPSPKDEDLCGLFKILIDSDYVDFIVIPGFDEPSELKKVVRLVEGKGNKAPWLILKITSRKVYEDLDSLLPLVKGVLIPRVELGLAVDPVRVPMITKDVIQVCQANSKIALVASEILASMRHNATPTRAEVSDIANAVLDGADGVVISEELPYGDHGFRGLELAGKTVQDVETGMRKGFHYNWTKRDPIVSDELRAVTFAAYRTAKRTRAKAIVCISEHGNTVLHLASYRTGIPIIAVTRSESVLRRLALVRGVYGFQLEDYPDIDHVLPQVNDLLLREASWLKEGDKFVFVSVTISSIGKAESNLFTVQALV